MLRPRPEPSDLVASLVPRMGDTPFAPGLPAGYRRVTRSNVRLGHVVPDSFYTPDPAREAADAAEQQAIADAVEGVLP